MSWFSYNPYVSAAERRAKSAKEAAKMAKKGIVFTPVGIKGRAIATTFWGKAWCKHLESFSDYENRLPRGRTYVRNGSVIDLKIEPAKITAQVMGSSLYKQTISITPIAGGRWKSIKSACSGRIDSLVELLQGRLSDAVMAVITDRDCGMFPLPSEIKMDCNCPDWAGLCKHLAAVLYGVGARFDRQPELLFTLRQADHTELITEAVSSQAIPASGANDLDPASLADVFGIDIDMTAALGERPSDLVSKTVLKSRTKAKPQAKKEQKKLVKPVKAPKPRAAKASKPAKSAAVSKTIKPVAKSTKAQSKAEPRKKPLSKTKPGKAKPATKLKKKTKADSPLRRRRA
ncbi:MAG: hypothetical protein WCH57_09245 [Verrucomicrobiota bacterium]